MARKPKLSQAEIRAAAADRRNGMTWENLSIKYQCAINTLRRSLSKHSTEFTPLPPTTRVDILQELKSTKERLTATEKELTAIKRVLKKRFNIHLS